jgi:hypothetical protein
VTDEPLSASGYRSYYPYHPSRNLVGDKMSSENYSKLEGETVPAQETTPPWIPAQTVLFGIDEVILLDEIAHIAIMADPEAFTSSQMEMARVICQIVSDYEALNFPSESE